jgi:hypothetical protein
LPKERIHSINQRIEELKTKNENLSQFQIEIEEKEQQKVSFLPNSIYPALSSAIGMYSQSHM